MLKSKVFEAVLSAKFSKAVIKNSRMSADSTREILATRQLYYLDEASEKRIVNICLGKPQLSPDGQGYECAFEINGIANPKAEKAHGCDAMQALQSALILVGANVDQLNNQLGRRLVWEGGVKGELGFP
jgi:hypothetical protein